MQPPTEDHGPGLMSRLREEQSRCWQNGDHVLVEDYLARHPDLLRDPKHLFELIQGEILHRFGLSESPSLDEYIRRFPSLETNLRGLWPLLQMLHSSGQPSSLSGAASTTGPDRNPTVALPPPLNLPGYRIVREIGRGGMGIVLEAVQLDLSRTVAIKLMKTGPLAGSEEMIRFRTEARAVARLRHSGVVQVHAFGEHEGNLFLVMEYLSAGSLADRLRQPEQLSFQEVATIVRQIALALSAAHASQIIHRDLKPGNILLDSSGSPKITDFGLARLLDADSGQTVSGMVMGTPSYMSPEQARGEVREIGPASDIWALGAILYECLTGVPPFKSKSRAETVHLVQTKAPASPRSLRPEVPEALETICLRCLEKRKQDRYATAEMVAEELGRWLVGEPIQKRLKWRSRLLVGAIVLNACLAALLGWALWPAKQEPNEIEEKLRRGEAVTLVKERPAVLGGHWLLGEDAGKITRTADGCWTLGTTGFALVQLLADPQVDHYRLTAELRQVMGSERSAMGLFIGRQQIGIPSDEFQAVVQITYNEFSDERITPVPVPDPPKHNAVRLFSLVHGGTGWDGKGFGAEISPVDRLRTAYFVYAEDKKKPWRRITIVVTSEQVELLWGDTQQAGERFPTDKISMAWTNGVKNRLNGPAPRFNPRGGLGVVADQGAISVRNVVVEPF